MDTDSKFDLRHPENTMRCIATSLGSRAVQVICQRLLQPTARFRRSLVIRRQCAP